MPENDPQQSSGLDLDIFLQELYVRLDALEAQSPALGLFQDDFLNLITPVTNPTTPTAPTTVYALGFNREIGVAWQLAKPVGGRTFGVEVRRDTTAAMTGANSLGEFQGYLLIDNDNKRGWQASVTRYYQVRTVGRSGEATYFSAWTPATPVSGTTLAAGSSNADLQTRMDTFAANVQALHLFPGALSVELSPLSQAISILSQQVSVLSQKVSVLSSLPAASVTSTELSAVSAQAASALSQALSTASVTDAALSAAINIVSNALSNQISIHNVLSNRVSANSGVASVTSTKLLGLSALSTSRLSIQGTAAPAAGIVQFDFSQANKFGIYTGTSAGDAKGVGQFIGGTHVDWAVHGNADPLTQNIQIHLAANTYIYRPSGATDTLHIGVGGAEPLVILSNVISAISIASPTIDALSQSISVVSNAASNALSVANAASNAASIVSVAVNVVSNALSNELSVRAVAINVVSNAVSVVSQALSAQAVALSVRVDAQSQAVSVLSQQVSALSQAHSVLSQAVSVAQAALSVRIDTQSQAISVLSQGVSIVSTAASNALSVANAASNAASVVSQAVSVVSVAAANALSVANVASNAASVVSQALSVAGAALSVRVDTQSQSISVLSQGLSIVSNAASNALSVANAASNAASVVSNAVSALSVKTVGPAFSGRTLSTLIPPGAPTKVRIDSEFFDTDNAFDAVTNFRFTPQVAGRYLIMASTALVLDGGGTRTVVVYIYKNGSSISQNTMITALNVGLGIQTMGLVSVNGTTDYLEMFVYHDNTLSTLLTGYPQTQFSGAFVR